MNSFGSELRKTAEQANQPKKSPNSFSEAKVTEAAGDIVLYVRDECEKAAKLGQMRLSTDTSYIPYRRKSYYNDYEWVQDYHCYCCYYSFFGTGDVSGRKVLFSKPEFSALQKSVTKSLRSYGFRSVLVWKKEMKGEHKYKVLAIAVNW